MVLLFFSVTEKGPIWMYICIM